MILHGCKKILVYVRVARRDGANTLAVAARDKKITVKYLRLVH